MGVLWNFIRTVLVFLGYYVNQRNSEIIPNHSILSTFLSKLLLLCYQSYTSETVSGALFYDILGKLAILPTVQ